MGWWARKKGSSGSGPEEERRRKEKDAEEKEQFAGWLSQTGLDPVAGRCNTGHEKLLEAPRQRPVPWRGVSTSTGAGGGEVEDTAACVASVREGCPNKVCS